MTTAHRYRFTSTIVAEPSPRVPGMMIVQFYDARGNHIHSDYWTEEEFTGSFEPVADAAPDADEQASA